MLFNSWIFAAFLAIVLPLYYLLPFRAQNILLLAASYLFYGAWDWRFLGLLLLSTVMDYSIGRAMDLSPTQRRRRLLLVFSVVVNLTILGFFKYWNFFVESAGALLTSVGLEANLPTLRIILPVGISFYTFQTLGYTIDIYRREMPACRNFLNYALYVSYFPQLVAGPIERITRLLPQIEGPRTVTPDMVYSGVQLMLWGFVKKIAIADSLAVHANRIFENPKGLHGVELWFGVYCFALQIYADFSGYTDIARGVSRLFGVELMLNFRQPYLSRNITEFWRRWHISLSTWLRDYLYVPLGGNRSGKIKQFRNLILTMLIGGLWHGASWTFVVWGGLHGVYLAVHRLLSGGRKIGAEPPPRTWAGWVRYAVSVFVTFHFVCLAWVWFRARTPAAALDYTRGLFRLTRGFDWSPLLESGVVHALVFYGVLSLLIDLPCWFHDRDTPFVKANPWVLRSLGYAGALFILAFVREGTSDAFIYFQF
jgi:D-alanyl-lipoteichoic acid acyltransferase DltB (MBOAT superfamily)